MNPTVAHLDQNHWIYLAKDYWGRPHKPAHSGIAQRLLAHVMSDRVRLPLSVIHLVEHGLAESASRRERLAEVFDRLGGGWFLTSWASVLPLEIYRAIAETFGIRPLPPEPEVLGRGFLSGIGLPEEELLRGGGSEEEWNQRRATAARPGVLYGLLTLPNEPGRSLLSARLNESDLAHLAAAEDLRARRGTSSREERRRIQYARYTLQHEAMIAQALQRIGRSEADFLALGRRRLCRLWAGVPSLDVDCELTLYRDRQQSRSVEAGDVRDIGHLVLAVPYCDVVVTERFWARALQETRLAQKYGTAVCTDIGELTRLIDPQ